VFIQKGYRRALLTDVGTDLGLSHAILYRYVESKEALFQLALLYAMDPEAIEAVAVPLTAWPKGYSLGLVKAWAADRARFPLLDAAAGDIAGDPAVELAGIVGECYEFVERNRRLLAVIERSAADVPDLYEFYFGELRAAYLSKLASYVQRRTAAGQLRPVPDAIAAARFITESIAWFAWHRKADPYSSMISDEQSRQTVRQLLLAAFVRDSGERAAAPVPSHAAKIRPAQPGRSQEKGA
jgi:AcrR family transcriptional regulator